jgi:hypothetical protein
LQEKLNLKSVAIFLIAISLLLSIASLATCHFGVQHEIDKIPPEIKAQMSDFDWIGIEWIAGGSIIFVFAAISAITALTLWLIDRRRGERESIRKK